MNKAKIWSYILVGLVGILNIIQLLAPVLPPKYSALATSILGIAAFFGFKQSHTEASLGQENYYKARPGQNS